MRRAALLVVLFSLLACGEKAKPLSEPGEKLYPVRGAIVSRNGGANSVRLDHEAIPGFMEAMVMDYDVRGADVASLPPDKTRVEAKLHVTSRSYWLTDVKSVP
jgi:protein SCO1/2